MVVIADDLCIDDNSFNFVIKIFEPVRWLAVDPAINLNYTAAELVALVGGVGHEGGGFD
jgi:hypothetical protein